MVRVFVTVDRVMRLKMFSVVGNVLLTRIVKADARRGN
jgi:hypothetical protein